MKIYWLLTAQIWAFVIFTFLVLEWTLQAIVKRLFPPSFGRRACALVTGFLAVVVLISTVPGRTRHLDFVRQLLRDELSERNSNGTGSGLGVWLETKVANLAVDLAVQASRVEKYGLISVCFIETEHGLSPVSVGFAGNVFRNFFIDIPIYEKPQVNISLANDSEGNRQLVLENIDATNYTCSVSSYAGETLSSFELEAKSLVRIQEDKAWMKSNLKRMLNGDKSLVAISEPIEQFLYVGFKRGGRAMKQAALMLTNDLLQVHWIDPK